MNTVMAKVFVFLSSPNTKFVKYLKLRHDRFLPYFSLLSADHWAVQPALLTVSLNILSEIIITTGITIIQF
jgi:hypothetical protein